MNLTKALSFNRTELKSDIGQANGTDLRRGQRIKVTKRRPES